MVGERRNWTILKAKPYAKRGGSAEGEQTPITKKGKMETTRRKSPGWNIPRWKKKIRLSKETVKGRFLTQ